MNANNDEVGGADLALLKMVHASKSVGFNTLVALRRRTRIVEIYEELDIPVIILPMLRMRASEKKLVKLSYVIEGARTARLLRRIIRDHDVDLVHANDFIDGIANFASWLEKSPSVQHVRVIGHKPRWLVALLKGMSLAFSTRIICVSYAVREEMYPKKHDKVIVLYDWVDMNITGQSGEEYDLISELSLPRGSRIVGCVGRVERWKGQHVFLSAAELLADVFPDMYFVVIGDPVPHKEDYWADLMSIHSQMRKKDHIRFLGNRTEISSIMRQLAVIVHTSVSPEPFGMVVMEAMWCGTVAVGSDAGGVREQIVDGVTGYLYAPGDPVDLAAKIIIALDDEKRPNIVSEAKKRVETLFSRERQLSLLIDVYESILPQS